MKDVLCAGDSYYIVMMMQIYTINYIKFVRTHYLTVLTSVPLVLVVTGGLRLLLVIDESYSR